MQWLKAVRTGERGIRQIYECFRIYFSVLCKKGDRHSVHGDRGAGNVAE